MNELEVGRRLGGAGFVPFVKREESLMTQVSFRRTNEAEFIPIDLGKNHDLKFQFVGGGILIRPKTTEPAIEFAIPLTPRESEVLSFVAEGCSNKMIGLQLSICERTVKNHIRCIMTKLQASDRTHAVVTAIRLGWLAI